MTDVENRAPTCSSIFRYNKNENRTPKNEQYQNGKYEHKEITYRPKRIHYKHGKFKNINRTIQNILQKRKNERCKNGKIEHTEHKETIEHRDYK